MIDTYRSLRSLPLVLQQLFLITLIHRTGSIAFPFYAIYLISNHSLSPLYAGWVVGMFGVGALLADIFVGNIIRRVGPVHVIRGSLMISALILLLLPAISQPAWLIVLTFIWGASYEAFSPAAFSATVRNSIAQERKIAFSCNRLAINLGTAVGPLMGSLIFVGYPQAVFIINGCVSLSALMISLIYKSNNSSDHVVLGSYPEVEPLPQERSRLVFALLSSLPIHIAYALPPTFLAAYIINSSQVPVSFIGVIFSVNALIVILFEVPINKKMLSVSDANSLLIGLIFAAAGFCAMSLESMPVALLIATVFWTLGEVIIYPSLTHHISKISSLHTADRNLGYYSAGVNVGVIIAPPLALFLVATIPAISPWLFVGMALILTAGALLAVRNSSKFWLNEK